MIAVVGVALKKREQERSQNFVDFISECSTNVLFLQILRDVQVRFSYTAIKLSPPGSPKGGERRQIPFGGLGGLMTVTNLMAVAFQLWGERETLNY